MNIVRFACIHIQITSIHIQIFFDSIQYLNVFHIFEYNTYHLEVIQLTNNIALQHDTTCVFTRTLSDSYCRSSGLYSSSYC